MRRSLALTAVSIAALAGGLSGAAATAAAGAAKEREVFYTITLTEARSVAKVDSFTVKQNVKPVQYKLDRAFVKSWSTSGDADAPPPPAGTSDLTMKRGTGPVRSLDGISRLVVVTQMKAGCRVGARYPTATMVGGGKSYTLTDLRITDCAPAGPEEQITFVYGKLVTK